MYEVVESKRWKNHVTGETASIYGAVPWTRSADEGAWSMETVGWTVRNTRTNTVGVGRVPWGTRTEAQQWADTENARLSQPWT